MHEVHNHLQQHTPDVARHLAQDAMLFNAQGNEKFMRFVTLIDRYINAMLQFLEVNVAHSILHQSNHPPEMPQA
jgi:hypothetical protein